jgi:hypothetical protein
VPRSMLCRICPIEGQDGVRSDSSHQHTLTPTPFFHSSKQDSPSDGSLIRRSTIYLGADWKGVCIRGELKE